MTAALAMRHVALHRPDELIADVPKIENGQRRVQMVLHQPLGLPETAIGDHRAIGGGGGDMLPGDRGGGLDRLPDPRWLVVNWRSQDPNQHRTRHHKQRRGDRKYVGPARPLKPPRK